MTIKQIIKRIAAIGFTIGFIIGAALYAFVEYTLKVGE